MVWNLIASRAVFPGQALQSSTEPVLGTAQHAAASPLPYGMGLVSVDELGARRPLPLYFISEAVAAARDESVRSGWYVSATPGVSFELCLTLVQNDYRKVDGYTLSEDKGIEMDLFVDGVKPGARSYQFSNCSSIGSEIIVPGFRESAVFPQGSALSNQMVRPFVFGKVATMEMGNHAEDDTCGCIQLKVYTGKVHSLGLNSLPGQAGPSPSKRRRKVKETDSVKQGKTIEVNGSETTAEHQTYRSGEYIERSSCSYQGGITIYLREQFWLDTHCFSGSKTRRGHLGVGFPDSFKHTIINCDSTDDEPDYHGSGAKIRNVKVKVVDLTKANESFTIREEVDLTID